MGTFEGLREGELVGLLVGRIDGKEVVAITFTFNNFRACCGGGAC